eukprot:Skav230237  [mRNA]  locus=scaffold4204:191750:192580:- [translate_table: standard]
MAWYEQQQQMDVQFADEIIEADGGRIGKTTTTSKAWFQKRRKRFPNMQTSSAKPKAKANAKTKPSKTVSHGRLLVIKGRFSKKSVLKPLPSKNHARGAHGAPETKPEVMRHVRKHVRADSCVAGSDSGSALVATWKKFSVPYAAACHAKDELTPTKSLSLAKCSAAQKKTLKKASLAKKPAAKISGQSAQIVGGDNECESSFSSLKRNLRRQNLIGRNSPRQMHVDALSAKFNLRSPGLHPILTALGAYRQAKVSTLGNPPADFLDINKDKDWLWS